MGMNGTPEYFTASCYITHIKTDRTMWYIACPDCKKKVSALVCPLVWLFTSTNRLAHEATFHWTMGMKRLFACPDCKKKVRAP